MRKLYSLITLLTAFVAAGVCSASAAKTVHINCGYPDAIEVRDGGAEGTLMTLTGTDTELTFESESVFIKLIDDEKQFSSVQYNNYYNGEIVDNTCTLLTEDLTEGTYINVNLIVPTKVSINVPDPSLVTIRPGGQYDPDAEISEGLNIFKLGPYEGFWIGVKDPDQYKLTKVWRTIDEKQFSVSAFKECSVWGYDINDGDIFSYTVVPASEFEAPSFSLTIIGDPEKVNVSIDYNDLKGLVAGLNKIEMAGSTANVSISHVNYGTALCSLTLNGKELQDSYGSYWLNGIKADDELVLTVDFPDEDYLVTIASDPAENLPFITSVEVNEEPVEEWQSMTVHCGQKVRLNFDTNLYKFIGITSNGENMELGYVYGYVDLKITKNNDFVVKSEKYPTYNAKIIINNPQGVQARVNALTLNLTEGENTVEFTENARQLYVSRNSGYLLNSVTCAKADSEPEVVESYPVTLEEGMTITIDATPIDLDWNYVVYSDVNTLSKLEPGVAWEHDWFYYFTFQDEFDRVYQYFPEGYSIIPFCEARTKHRINWSTKLEAADIITHNNIYLNGTLLPWNYGVITEFVDGDVVKIFLTKDPATYTATFNVAEGCEIEAVKDLVTPVEDLTATLSELEGTLIQLKNANADNPIEVFVEEVNTPAAQAEESDEPGTKVEADDKGIYNITLDSSKAITIRAEKQSGVENVAIGNITADNDVYTVTGSLVLRGATAAQIKALPAGIYIVGNQKVVVR